MNVVQHLAIGSVRCYQLVISPAKVLLFGPLGHCRFTPTCSEYAAEAIRVHGALAGSWLALKRIVRCHPWGGCGADAVPQAAALVAAQGQFANGAGTARPLFCPTQSSIDGDGPSPPRAGRALH